jgi:hypothetical protein
VYTSSRGSCLRLQDAIVTSVLGGRLSTLADEAVSSLNDIEGHKFVYLLCGIPDITFLLLFQVFILIVGRVQKIP